MHVHVHAYPSGSNARQTVRDIRGLCCSGHAYQSELEEILQTVKPKHFLPVHGESAFLYAHAELAQDLGCRNTSVIRNGEMLGVSDIRNKEHVSMGTAAVRP